MIDPFSEFEKLDEATINAFVKEGKEEHLQLEFKQIKSASLKSEDDNTNFSDAIAGFANAVGGVIIWGVNASKIGKGKYEVDVAHDLCPIEPLVHHQPKKEE